MGNGKHAYLIMAHANFEELAFLLEMLDDPRNDLFVHIDRKASFSAEDGQRLRSAVSGSRLFFTLRTDVRWGDYSQIACEMLLFRTAQRQAEKDAQGADAASAKRVAEGVGSAGQAFDWAGDGEAVAAGVSRSESAAGGVKEKKGSATVRGVAVCYDFYHVLSGQDLPIASQGEIHAFFDGNRSNNFLSLVSGELREKTHVEDRIRYDYHFSRHTDKAAQNKFEREFFNHLNKLDLKIQRRRGVDRLRGFYGEVGYASNWLSLNGATVQALLKNEKWIERVFRNSYCADELFVPTFLIRAGLTDTIWHREPVHDRPDELQGNLRYINWWEKDAPLPYTWTGRDLERLEYAASLGHLWARKFDVTKDPVLEEWIVGRCGKARG